MKTYYLNILEQVFVGIAFSWLLYSEYQRVRDSKLNTNVTSVREDSPPAFDYPALPDPFPGKFMQKQSYNHPFILVAGHPRSGTTLMRSMLDAHDMVRCGEETHIIPTISQVWDSTLMSNVTIQGYADVGLTQQVLDKAVANFLMVVIVEHGSLAQRMCNKDPLTMNHAVYINRLFPHSKFIFMVRDGRATVHSAITRKVGIATFDLRSYEKSMRAWDDFERKMYTQCEKLGPKICHPVYYEELILKPRDVMKKVLQFLELPWQGEVLKHEEFIAKEGGIKLNPKEPSTNQVSKARYEDALTSWVGKIPSHILEDMDRIAPMLSVLGYDPMANPPLYNKLKYRWGEEISERCVNRSPYRWFVSALYHKMNDTAVEMTEK